MANDSDAHRRLEQAYRLEKNPVSWPACAGWEDRNLAEKAATVFGFIVLGIGLLFLFGYVVMLLWNWLMPEIFGLKTLAYWQAWGMLALSCILFGRIGGGGSKSSRSDRKRKRRLRSHLKDAE